MKAVKLILAGVLPALLAVGASAQQGSGFYEPIRYRDNDPFVFCTQGPSIKMGEIQSPACWLPRPPYTGQYMLTGGCNPPNKYGRDWDQADTDSLQQYIRICPHAIDSGQWEGEGRPESTPREH